MTHSLDVGLHPTAIAWDEARQRLYVANANQDSISVVSTIKNRVADTVSVKPFGLTLKGVAPIALCLSPDGRRLYAALAGFNAVAVIDADRRVIQGFIPTAWYPNHLSMSSDGKRLAVATLLGVGSGWQDVPARRYVHAYRGTVAVLAVPDDAELASYTTTVAENNRIATARAQLDLSQARPSTPNAVPARAGDPSLVLRSGVRRPSARKQRTVAGDVRRRRHTEPSQAGERIRPSRQLLRDRRQLGRWAPMGDTGE